MYTKLKPLLSHSVVMFCRSIRCFMILAGLFTILSPNSVLATTYLPKPRAELLARAEFIGRILVVSGEVYRIEFEGESIICGAKYVALVQEALLGDLREVEFSSDDFLELRRDYLVFLTSGDTTTSDIVMTSSYSLPNIKKGETIQSSCDEYSSSLKTLKDTTSAFSGIRAVARNSEVELEKWIEWSHIASGPDVQKVSFKPDTVKVVVGKNSEIIPMNELEDPWTSRETTRLPGYYDYKALLRWPDVRKFIIGQLEELKYNKSINNAPSEPDSKTETSH